MDGWLPNKSWETGDAGVWAFTGSAPPTVGIPPIRPSDPAVAHDGLYVAGFYSPLAAGQTGLASYNEIDPVRLALIRGHTLTWGTWNWLHSEMGGIPGGYLHIQLFDGVNTVTNQIWPAGGPPYDAWRYETVSLAVSPIAAQLSFRIYWHKIGGGSIMRWVIDDMDVSGLPPIVQTNPATEVT